MGSGHVLCLLKWRQKLAMTACTLTVLTPMGRAAHLTVCPALNLGQCIWLQRDGTFYPSAQKCIQATLRPTSKCLLENWVLLTLLSTISSSQKKVFYFQGTGSAVCVFLIPCEYGCFDFSFLNPCMEGWFGLEGQINGAHRCIKEQWPDIIRLKM